MLLRLLKIGLRIFHISKTNEYLNQKLSSLTIKTSIYMY